MLLVKRIVQSLEPDCTMAAVQFLKRSNVKDPPLPYWFIYFYLSIRCRRQSFIGEIQKITQGTNTSYEKKLNKVYCHVLLSQFHLLILRGLRQVQCTQYALLSKKVENVHFLSSFLPEGLRL